MVRPMFVLMLLPVFAACQSTSGGFPEGQSRAQSVEEPSEAPASGPSRIPPMSKEDKEEIILAMREMADRFYKTDSKSDFWAMHESWYHPTLKDDVKACLQIPSPWSPLTMHYFCQMLGYVWRVHPNPRECFRVLVDPQNGFTIGGKPPTYETVYNYCAYMPVNRRGLKDDGELYNIFNEYSKPEFSKNLPPLGDDVMKVDPKPDRPMAWFVLNKANNNRQDRVFRKLMIADTCSTISSRDQQEIINAYYGVDLGSKPVYTADDKEQTAECRLKRPRWGANDPMASTSQAPFVKMPTDGMHCSLSFKGCEDRIPAQ